MLSTLQTLQTAQTASPAPTAVPGPPGAAVEALRRRNAALDALFYDVGVITDDEARAISPWLAREGAILHVPPSGAGPLTLCGSADALLQRAPAPRSLAIAGVGSSALGAAAFARNIADATNAPTAAVVSGYGLSDLVSEALGGWLLFGSMNQIRHAVEAIDEVMRPAPQQSPEKESMPGQSRDTVSAVALLEDPRFTFDLLTGHSKGNLVLSEALYAATRRGGRLARRPSETLIVTFSAAIRMPSVFPEIIDVMGGWDWFGGLNSRASIPIDTTVPNAWHHTNTELPFHLPVTRTLTEVLAGR